MSVLQVQVGQQAVAIQVQMSGLGAALASNQSAAADAAAAETARLAAVTAQAEAEAAATEAVAATINKLDKNGANVADAAVLRANIGATALDGSNITDEAGFRAAISAASRDASDIVAADYRAAMGVALADDTWLVDETFNSTVTTQPTGNAAFTLNSGAVGRAYDTLLINHEWDTASNGVHVLGVALAGATAGQSAGFAKDGAGVGNAATCNKRGAGDGNGAEGNILGSGSGYGLHGICSSTGPAVAAVRAFKQNDTGIPSGTAGTGPALEVTNISNQGRAIDSTTAANNVTSSSNLFTRLNSTNGVNLDVINSATDARTGAYIGVRSVMNPGAAWGGASEVSAFQGTLNANVTGAVEAKGAEFINDAAGNTTGYGVIAYSRGANVTNYGARFIVSGGTSNNISIRGDGGDIWVVGGVYRVDGVSVVGPRGAAVADATDAASVITQLNALLARLRTHGLIST